MRGPYGAFGTGLGSYGMGYGRFGMGLGGMSPYGYMGGSPYLAGGLGLGYGYGAGLGYGMGAGSMPYASDPMTASYLGGGAPYMSAML